MKKDIPFYINRYLLTKPELYVQGLGVFTKKFNSASWSADKKIIQPPYFTTEFQENESKKESDFVEFISYLTGEKGVECARFVDQFVTEIRDKLTKSGTFEWPHFGRFFSSNEQVKFEPEVNSGQLNLWNLKALEIRPSSEYDDSLEPEFNAEEFVKIEVTPEIETIIEEIEQPQDIVQETVQEIEDIGDSQNEVESEVKISEEIIELPADFEFKKMKQVVKPRNVTSAAMEAPRFQATMYPSASTFKKSRDNEWQGRILGWLFGIALILLIVSTFASNLLLPKLIDNSAAVTTTPEVYDPIHSAIPLDSSEIDAIESKGQETKSESDNNSIETTNEAETAEQESILDEPEAIEDVAPANIVSDAGDCMIVVGAFKDEANVEKMENLLLDMGLEPYHIQRVGLWHVGVRKPCRTALLRKALYQTREQITGEAWVLRISGTPP